MYFVIKVFHFQIKNYGAADISADTSYFALMPRGLFYISTNFQVSRSYTSYVTLNTIWILPGGCIELGHVMEFLNTHKLTCSLLEYEYSVH